MVGEAYQLTIAFNCTSEIKTYFFTFTMDKNSNFQSLEDLNVQQLKEELNWLRLEREDLRRQLKFSKRKCKELTALFKTDEEE